MEAEATDDICDAGQCRACANSAECSGDSVCVRDRCQECEPDTHEQCGENSLTPFCSPAGICVACANDFECQARPGVQDTCVNGQCRRCDHEAGDNRGCDETSTEPICRLLDGSPRCAGCVNGDECDPFLCDEVDGRCAACQPNVPGLAGQRGCGVASIGPSVTATRGPADHVRLENVTLAIFNTASMECASNATH